MKPTYVDTGVLLARANVPDGVPDHVQRIVSENCRTLKFKDFGFEQR